jgi:hypothetical protein
MGKARWKVVSPKKLSARKRDILEKEQVGIPFSKGAGFCWIYNSVLCSYQKSGSEGYMERCERCSHFIRAEHDSDEEDEAENREVEEVFRRFPVSEEIVKKEIAKYSKK